ncbi:MAG: hypothetical protein EOO08_04725 [Chitinophagaceae bacterium]|nr:MAG: hypothetical protein EOO08_04725 [Chitinophagaceae bacterium]
MPNKSSDDLFNLIHSLQKAEKRNFKLYITRNSSNEDLKIVHLFDALDKMRDYDEALLLKKVPSIKKQQLPNSKAHLYRQLLASLRLLSNDENIDIQLHESLDYARILYNKGLYLQSLRILERLKETAKSYNQDSFLIQIISLEKKIEVLHITRSMEGRAEQLTHEAEEINEKRRIITHLSNLALQLYSWYIKNGHARNEQDEADVKEFFRYRINRALRVAAKHLVAGVETTLPEGTTASDLARMGVSAEALARMGFYEALYLYQSYMWFAFIRQDFLQYYRYVQKWVDLFQQSPQMIQVETGHYIKGLHNLCNAHFDLRNFRGFQQVLDRFEAFDASDLVQRSHNNRVQTFIYLTTARINQHFMLGTFREGLALVPFVEEKLTEYSGFIDRHRVLVFYYKIASLYFGSGDHEKAIDYLHKIIHWKVDLRNDLQCYARLLHLMAHYELGNYDLMEYLVRSVYRYMAKMQNLTVIEEQMFAFLRQHFHHSPRRVHEAFRTLLEQMKQYEKSRFETRAFAYLDIISWLESKVRQVPMAEVVREKYEQSKRRPAPPVRGRTNADLI